SACNAGADRQAQQGAATGAGTVGEDIPEFNCAAGREMLSGFHEDSHTEHGETRDQASVTIPESDYREQRQGQVGAEVHYLVVDVQTTEVHYQRRGGRQQGADDHTAHEYGPEDQDEDAAL